MSQTPSDTFIDALSVGTRTNKSKTLFLSGETWKYMNMREVAQVKFTPKYISKFLINYLLQIIKSQVLFKIRIIFS
jgi:hypothetical protein